MAGFRPDPGVGLKNSMSRPTRKVMALSLAAGSCLLMAVAIGVSIAVYNSANEVDYSPFNHLFSELGWAKHAPAAGFFNFSLGAASIMNAPLFWLFGLRMGNGPGRAAAVTGLLACWACYGVGLIPLGGTPFYLEYQGGRLGLHFPIAAVFFWAWIVTMALSLMALLVSPAGRRMPGLIAASALALGAAFAFLAMPNERIVSQLAKGIIKARADFYWTATLEWSVVGTIGLWLLAAIHSLWKEGAQA